MKKYSLLLLLLPILSFAQDSSAVKFYTLNNWKEVLKKAKEQQKYIFVDAYATWCGPCKEMDKNVYINDSVGSYLNKLFISIKIQLDQNNTDKPQIKQWYPDASYFQKTYNIEVFPTFLFFNPNGELINKEFGYQNISDFLTICKQTADSNYNFTGLLKSFKKNKASLSQKMALATIAKKLGENTLSIRVAQIAINEMNQKHLTEILTPSLLPFIQDFGLYFKDQDNLIRYIFNNQQKADSIMQWVGFSQNVINYMIINHLINPQIYPNEKIVTKNPNWNKLEKKISNIWGAINAKQSILEAKIKYYRIKNEWNKVVKYSIEQQDLKGITTEGLNSAYINNLVWGVIFTYSNDIYALNKGITYMEILLKSDPNSYELLDTYANILYKAGQIEKALENEKKAISIVENLSLSENSIIQKITEFKENLEKMEKGLPTWQ